MIMRFIKQWRTMGLAGRMTLCRLHFALHVIERITTYKHGSLSEPQSSVRYLAASLSKYNSLLIYLNAASDPSSHDALPFKPSSRRKIRSIASPTPLVCDSKVGVAQDRVQ